MKVAVIGAKYKDKNKDVYKKIRDSFEKMGNKVDFSYFKTSVEDDASNLEDTFKRNSKLIKNCDVLVAETTDYSSGIGYLIANALSEKKPVLALHNKKSTSVPSNTIKASEASKLLTFSEYNETELNEVINTFLVRVKNILDTKFILIISPQIDKYLEWAADYRRMHKAQIVRNAVEDMMNKDKEWKKSQS